MGQTVTESGSASECPRSRYCTGTPYHSMNSAVFVRVTRTNSAVIVPRTDNVMVTERTRPADEGVWCDGRMDGLQRTLRANRLCRRFSLRVCIYVCMYLCRYVCIYVYMYVCINASINVCINICMFV